MKLLEALSEYISFVGRSSRASGDQSQSITCLYFVPEDPYFVRIHSSLFEEISLLIPDSKHIFCPIYDLPFYKYPVRGMRSIARETLKKRLHLVNQKKKVTALLNRYIPGFSQSLKSGRALIVPPVKWDLSGKPNSSYSIQKSDLLVDTYIRYRPSPWHDPSSQYWRSLNRHADKLISFTAFLNAHFNIDYVFGSYATYIHHGIHQRVSLEMGATTFTFGSNSFFRMHKYPKKIPSHTSDYLSYAYPFICDDRDYLLRKAEESLKARIKGQVDLTTSYMRSSSEGRLKDSELRGNVVLFLHDFFDSSHVYRWSLFDSHYEWAVKTIDMVISNHRPIYIKPHPNGIKESQDAVRSLRKAYASNPFVHWIDSGITNESIFSASPSLIVTVYGSVGPEACYAGLRVLYAGDHPAINFPIGTNPSSIASYFELLLNPSSVNIGPRDAALAFVAQHYRPLFLKTDMSLHSFIGESWDKLEEDPSLLDSGTVKSYLISQSKQIASLILASNNTAMS